MIDPAPDPRGPSPDPTRAGPVASAQRKSPLARAETRFRRSADRIDIDDNIVFYIVASASFVEITSDLYTRNLAEFFRGDDEIVGWLGTVWQEEELGHGEQLKNYVVTAWPAFDWATAYQRFYEEFLPHCAPSAMAASPAQELVALCVVETGTASLYRMLADATAAPELRRIAASIGGQEIGHYKQFLRYFLRYRARDQVPVSAILRAFWTQVTEINGIDAYFAFKHVYLGRNPGKGFDPRLYQIFRQQCRKLSAHHFPHRMAVKMLLKLLPLPPIVERLMVRPLTSATRLLFRVA